MISARPLPALIILKLLLATGSMEASEQLPLLPEEEAAPPQLFIRAFADSTFEVRSERPDLEESSSAFGLGELDLFITSQLSPDVSVLSELVFHFEEERDAEFLEVERLTLKYAPLDAFNLEVGRLHTPIGYWNHNFHHGRWLQTTISRPDIVVFEDDRGPLPGLSAGVLPMHSVGVLATGLKSLGNRVDLQYFAGVFNGRGRDLEEIQTVNDANDSKALNLQLNLVTDQSLGLQAGVSFYRDSFPQDPLTEGRLGEMRERIIMGHVVYLAHGIEFLAELAHIRHEEPASGRSFESTGSYAQLAYELRRLKPYARYDRVALDEEDPIFGFEHPSLDRVTVGVRWDPIAWLTLKSEYRSTDLKGFGRIHAGLVQVAFTF